MLGSVCTSIGSLLNRSAGRARPNSSSQHSPGQCRSPSRGQGAVSPNRGRRSSNWNKNAQKSLDFERALGPAELFPKLANETTPGKTRVTPRSPSKVSTETSGADSSCSEAGQEVASFLTSFPGTLPPKSHLAAIFPAKEQEEEYEVQVLTEEPDSDLEEEEEDEEEVEIAEERGEKEKEVQEEWLRLQLEELERVQRVAKEKDKTGRKGDFMSKLLLILFSAIIFYVSDVMIPFAEDRLINLDPQVRALKNLFKKQKQLKKEAKRKQSSEGSEGPSKKFRLDELLQDT